MGFAAASDARQSHALRVGRSQSATFQKPSFLAFEINRKPAITAFCEQMRWGAGADEALGRGRKNRTL